MSSLFEVVFLLAVRVHDDDGDVGEVNGLLDPDRPVVCNALAIQVDRCLALVGDFLVDGQCADHLDVVAPRLLDEQAYCLGRHLTVAMVREAILSV